MTVLIDSNIWIEYFQASEIGKKVAVFIEGKEKIIVSTLNIAEVFRHVLSKRNRRDAEKAIDIIQQYSFVVSVTTEIAKNAAILKHEKKFGLADAIIYATAIQEDATIVTADSDFKDETNVHYIQK